jgi:tetratricopeptide (TPR) repeat protein
MNWEEKKAEGNKAFGAGDFDAAVSAYSEAIELARDNHVLYSNRAAAYLSKREYSKALMDGEKCVEINSSFPKGYSRCAQSLRGLGKLEEAVDILKEGEKALENGGNLPLRGELGEMMKLQSQWENSKKLEEAGLAKYKHGGASIVTASKDLQKALALRRNVVGEKSELLHTLANNVRGALKAQGEGAIAGNNPSEAKRCFREAIACTAMAFGSDGVACGVLRSKLAMVLRDEGDLPGSYELLLENKGLYDRLESEMQGQAPTEHTSAAEAAEAAEEREIQIHSQVENLVALGKIAEARGERVRALGFVTEALAVRRCERTKEVRLPGVGQQKDELTILQNLAVLQSKSAKYEEAGRSLEQALELHTGLLRQAAGGREVAADALSATLLRDLGVAAWQAGGQTAATLNYFSQAHKMCTSVHGAAHEDTAGAALKVGAVLIQLQRWEDAETILRSASEVLSKRKSKSGADHPQAKVARDNLQIAVHKGKPPQ